MDSPDKKTKSAERTGSIAVTRPRMAVLSPGLPAVSAFGMLSQEFSSRIIDRAQTQVGGYGMYSLDFLSEDSGESSAVISPVFNLDMSVLLGKLEQLKTETNRETREHTERVIERVVELRLERERAKLPPAQKSQNRDTAEKPQIKGEKPQTQPKSAEKKEKPAVTGRDRQPASFYQITQNFYTGLLPSRDAAAGRGLKAASGVTETKKSLKSMQVRQSMTEHPPEMLFSKVLGGLQRLELTYASETESIPDGPVSRDSFLKQTSEKYKKENYIPDFVRAEIKAAYGGRNISAAAGQEQGLEHIDSAKAQEEKRQPLPKAEKTAAEHSPAQAEGIPGLELSYAQAAEEHGPDAPPPAPHAEDAALSARKAPDKRELFRTAYPEAAEEALELAAYDTLVQRESEKAFLRPESAEGSERIIYRNAESGTEAAAQTTAEAESLSAPETLEYQLSDGGDTQQTLRQIGILKHFQSASPRTGADSPAPERTDIEYALPEEPESAPAPVLRTETAPRTAAPAKRAPAEKTAAAPDTAPETFLRQEAQESEYIKSLPDWTRDFLKNGYEPVPTVLSTAAPESTEAVRAAPESAGAQREAAPPELKSLPAQEEQIVWTNPTLAPPPASSAPPPQLSLKQPESGEVQQPACISDAEIKRAADKVYKMIEDRLRREKRRLGL